MNYLITLFLVAALCLTGCSTMNKPVASVSIPFAAITDTVVAPFQLIGDAGVVLIEIGDRHQLQVYEANKDSTTLPLAELTTLIFYIPGYLLYPVDSITPETYFPLTKNCLNAINADSQSIKKNRPRKTRKLPKDNFEEWD